MGSQTRTLFSWLCVQVIFASVYSDVWKANVVSEINGLQSSCVVLPCTFNYPGKHVPDSRMRGIWHMERQAIIYHDDQSQVTDSFKGRTKLLGRLGDKNCTLEIEGIRSHENGPFCFRSEIPGGEKYSFVQNCATISVILEAPKPTLEKTETLEEGVPASLKCSVEHTCPSHPPTLIWSHLNEKAFVNHKDRGSGRWEVESTLTFIPTGEDDHKKINCMASFHGSKSSETSTVLYVKREANIYHIIIPAVAVLGVVLFSGGVCYFMSKKYKRQIQELQSGNGIWSRMSRMSQRFRSVDQHFQAEQEGTGL